MNKSNIISELDSLTEYWSQKVLEEANGQQFKVAKGIGPTNWHKHDDQDELFIIFDGEMTIELRDRNIELSRGEIPCSRLEYHLHERRWKAKLSEFLPLIKLERRQCQNKP